MTAQIGENLRYEGKDYSMCTEPLNQYFALGGDVPKFESTCTALWRGYVGSWEIINKRLYLAQLSGNLEGGAEASMTTIFPDYPDRVFAHWYSGTLRVPDGKMLEYEHMGYGSTYETDIQINVEQGVVQQVTVQTNGISDDHNALEGYGIAAFTTFSNQNEVDKG